MMINFKHIILVSVLAPQLVLANDSSDDITPNYSDQSAIEGTGNPDFIGVQDELSSIKHKIDYFQQQNYIERINSIQKEIQDLRGLVDMQSHQLEALRKQISPNQMDQQPASQQNIAVQTSDDEASQYGAAFNYLKNRDYDKAIVLFNKFLTEHKDGNYVPNVHYWLGEIYLLQGKYDLAESNLVRVIANYAEHSKVPDSMLKLAMVYVNTNKVSQAKELVARLEQQYPNSTASRMAKMQLGNLIN